MPPVDRPVSLSLVSWRAVLVVLVLSAIGSAQERVRPHIIPEGPLSPAEQQKKFHVPPGFKIELVASEPEIRNPLSLDFDSRGRLWVTDTIEYPFPPNGPGRDALKAFEDTDGDGNYDSMTALIDTLSMPTGVTPVPDGAIVFSIPSIFRCWDSNGDGRLDQRKALYSGFGDVDAHGMNNGFTRWMDGWIYACHGYANTSDVQGADGHSVAMNSGNGYRYRWDGSHIEYVWHGQVNPYGIAFDELGNLFTADCHSKPAYCLLRGAYYPSFGKPHDGLGFGPKLIEHSHGSTSISGIAYYAASQFPEDYRDCVYMGNSVTGRVNRDQIHATGSSLAGTECPDFVTCDDRWFRPVEIKLGPDGALYIADFYDCIIGYYEVPLTHPRRDRTRGRIWRVVYTGSDEAPRTLRKVPNLTKFDLDRLWQRLADANLCQRLLATHEIVDRFGKQAVEPLSRWIGESSTPHQRAHGLWILERLGALDDQLVERLAADEHRLVRLHLVKALAERADWGESSRNGEWVVPKLSDADAMVRRAAADALGRHPDPANVPRLLRLWAETPAEDSYLIHTVRMALRDHLMDAEILDQYAHLDLDAGRLRRLLDVVLGVRNAQSAAFVFAALDADKHDPSRTAEWIHHATRFSAADQLDAIAQLVLSWRQSPTHEQLNVFRSYGLAIAERGAQIPAPFHAWGERLASELLQHSDLARVAEGIQLADALRLRALYEPLAEIVRSKNREAVLRQAAMRACVSTGDSRRLALLDAVLGDGTESPGMRRAAAFSLSLLNTEESRHRILERMLTSHHQLAALLAAALAGSESGAELLLETISEGKASPLLLRELAVLRRLEGLKLPDLDARLAKLTEHLPPLDEMTAQRTAQRRTSFVAAKPDAVRGKEVFTKQCALCHLIGGEGRKFGPDLDGIGVRGLDRLLEDLLDPNRNVDPAFHSTIVVTLDGLIHTGLALNDEGNLMTLVDGEGKELKIRHDEIDERLTSPLSPMPYVAENTVDAEDFNHLLRYLLDNNTPAAEE